MAIRSIERLRRVQAEMLKEFQASAESGSAGPVVRSGAGGESEGLVLHLGRVSQVVTSDGTYGPHLMVVPQRVSGTPPTPSDTSVPAQRAYATPNNSVSSYSVNDYVVVWIIRGARLAVRLA